MHAGKSEIGKKNSIKEKEKVWENAPSKASDDIQLFFLQKKS